MKPTVRAALLQLLAHGSVPPETLRTVASQIGTRHAVEVALWRMRKAGLVEVKVELTDKGRQAARGVRA